MIYDYLKLLYFNIAGTSGTIIARRPTDVLIHAMAYHYSSLCSLFPLLSDSGIAFLQTFMIPNELAAYDYKLF